MPSRSPAARAWCRRSTCGSCARRCSSTSAAPGSTGSSARTARCGSARPRAGDARERRALPTARRAQALPHVGHVVTRNRGTVGGSIAHADGAAELCLCLAALGGAVVNRPARDRGPRLLRHALHHRRSSRASSSSRPRWPVRDERASRSGARAAGRRLRARDGGRRPSGVTRCAVASAPSPTGRPCWPRSAP